MRRWQGASHHALQYTLGLWTGALRALIIVAMEGMHKRMYWECGLPSRCDAIAATTAAIATAHPCPCLCATCSGSGSACARIRATQAS